MGLFREEITISNPNNPREFIELEAIVDNGSIYTWIPKGFLKELGIVPRGKRKFRLANGEVIEREIGVINIAVKEETLPTLCVFGDSESEPLVGAVTLEEFSLGIDPVNKRLIPVISWALSAKSKNAVF